MKRYFGETLGEHTARVKKQGYNKPLRTLSEMADELGAKAQSICTASGIDTNAPKCKLVSHTGGGTKKWYDPDEVRAWWKQRKAAKC